MADKNQKQPENVPGPYYVDKNCAPCLVCLAEAPDLIKESSDGSYSYFIKQPETPEEEAAAKEAMDICPVEAIGNDGA